MSQVDVIIPVFNGERWLERAITSVRSQSFKDWTLTVVDDGSDDSTWDIANSFADEDKRIKAVKHSLNKGLSASRNTGLAHGVAPYVQFLDADDELLVTKLEKHHDFLESNPAVDVVYSRAEYWNAKGPCPDLYPVPSAERFLPTLLDRNFIVVNGALARRQLCAKLGAFKESSNTDYPIYGCEDWDYWLRAALLGARFAFLDEILVRNFRHEENMSKDIVRMCRSHVWVMAEALEEDLPFSLKIQCTIYFCSRWLRFKAAQIAENESRPRASSLERGQVFRWWGRGLELLASVLQRLARIVGIAFS